MMASREASRSRWELDEGREFVRPRREISSRPKAGQARQGQGQDGAGLLVGQPDLVAVDHDGARIGDELDQGHHVPDRPALAGHQAFARLGRILGGADDDE